MAPAHVIEPIAKSLVDGLPDAAVFLDKSLTIRHFNNAYALFTGLRRRSLERKIADGATAFELAWHDAETDRNAAQESLINGQSIRLDEVTVTNSKGDSFVSIMAIIPITNQDGDVVGIVQTLRDVSGEARMQGRYKELLALERARAEELERQVAQRTEELQVALEEVTRLSKIDPLTGLSNRRSFTEIAEQALAVAHRHGRTAGLLMCDLDFFKRINDNYGHQAGDAVLIAAGKALSGVLRRTDLVGRFGGEEFVILLTETNYDSVMEVGRRCARAIRELSLPDIVPGATGKISVSIGVSIYPQHGDSLDELVGRADEALYHAKEHGRDQVCLYDKDNMAAVDEGPSDRIRVLLIMGNDDEAAEILAALRGSFDTMRVRNTAEAMLLLQHTNFEAYVAPEALGDDSGIDFFVNSYSRSPDALRVLIIDSEDVYVAIRGTNVGHVDYFVLSREDKNTIILAIEDGLTRRELNRERLLRSGTSRSFAVGEVSELQSILDERKLDFNFQPIVAMPGRRTVAYEALCRPNGRTLNNPRLLFDTAVASGKIWLLSRLVRRMLCDRLAELPQDAQLFINLHPADLDDPDLLDGEEFIIPYADRIVFEITERAAIPDFKRCKQNLNRLREHGFRFAIDDLGAGYASLNSVALLEPDYIKIDMALIRNIETSSPQAKLVQRMIEYAADADIQVVAEGIETEHEAEVVTDLGCPLMQGYHFARPGPGFDPA